jgi:hypothetical protein
LAGLTVGAAAADINCVWIGTGYGDWSDPANWQGGVIPVNSVTDKYHVTIALPDPSAFSQSALTQAMTVSELTLGNNIYLYSPSGSDSLQFHVLDNFHWLGGGLDGNQAQYHLHGEAVFDGLTSKGLGGACTLTLHGHARWTQGNLGWAGYGSVTNSPGASFDITAGGYVGSIGSTDDADIYNQGTMQMNAAGQTAQFYSDFHNSGAIEVEAGDLQFMGNYDGAGAISVQAGARVIFWGTGEWQSFAQAGAGELYFVGGETVLSDTTFTCFTRVAANFGCSGNLTLSNAVWQSGQISGPGSLIVPAGGNLSVQTTAPRFSCPLLNSGELSLAAGAYLYANIGATLTNFVTGRIHLASASSLGLNGFAVGSLANDGSILKDDVAVGSAAIYATFQNRGLIRSSAGRLTLNGSGTNLGQLEARSPGQITAQSFDFGASSALVGDGQISLLGGTLRGTVDTNLDLVVSSVVVSNASLYSFKSLQAANWVRFSDPGGAEVRGFLTLNGGLYGGLLRSLQSAELSFPAATQIKGGARLELLGESSLLTGSLTVQDTNSTLLNSGTMHVEGASDLLVNPGAGFLNQGAWHVSAQMGSFKIILTDKLCRLTVTNASTNMVFGDGPFQLSGPVTVMPQQVTAGAGAQLCVSDLAMTNVCLWLSQSALTVTTNLSSSNATVVLDQATLTGPVAPWTGSMLLRGQGTLQGAVAPQSLQLDVVSNINHLVLNGSLSMAGTNALLRATVVPVQGAPTFSYLQVHGPVALNGRFDLMATVASASSNLMGGPVTLVDSDQPLTGSFLNATNGAILSTTNGFRFLLWYGPGNPFGANKIVLSEFGTAFDRWRLHHFSAQQLGDPLVSGPTADPDHSGWNNLMKFVLAVDTTPPGAAVPSLGPGPTGYATLHVRKRKDVGSLQATIALSQDLRVWQQTALGASPSWMELHRVFDLGDSYDYTYLYPGTPAALFLKIIISGQY